jgi:hypothetical protein
MAYRSPTLIDLALGSWLSGKHSIRCLDGFVKRHLKLRRRFTTDW